MTASYANTQAGLALKQARTEYGPGWGKLTEEQRKHYVSHYVLMLILSQDDAKYAPAQLLAQSVLDAVEQG